MRSADRSFRTAAPSPAWRISPPRERARTRASYFTSTLMEDRSVRDRSVWQRARAASTISPAKVGSALAPAPIRSRSEPCSSADLLGGAQQHHLFGRRFKDPVTLVRLNGLLPVKFKTNRRHRRSSRHRPRSMPEAHIHLHRLGRPAHVSTARLLARSMENSLRQLTARASQTKHPRSPISSRA